MEESNTSQKKNHKLVIILVLLIIIVLLLTGYLVYDKIIAKNKVSDIKTDDLTVVKDPKKEYTATIDAYGEAVTHVITEYMKKSNGTVPKWSDIEANIPPFTNKVTCTNHINYDGSIYLSNCTVANIDYKSDYTYGKKLNEPIKSTSKIYIYENTIGDYKSTFLSDKKYDDMPTYKLLDTYSCVKDICDGLAINNLTGEAIIYDENVYYIYDYKTTRKKEINLGSKKYKNMGFLISKKDTYGIYVFNDDQKAAIYNYKQNKYITNFIYDGVINYNINELLDNNYYAGYKRVDNKYTLYILKNDGEIYKSFEEFENIESTMIGDKVFYLMNNFQNNFTYKIYNSNFEPLLKENNYYYYAINTHNTINLYNSSDKTKFYIYDTDGNKILESKPYKEVIKVLKDYIVILDDEDNLKLIDTNEKEITTFLKITDDYRIHSLISGWHTENGKNGIYMVIENKKIPYGTEGSGLEYYYIPDTQETGVIKTIGVGGYAKPVLYLYPTKKTKINVSFKKPELLTTTYPKYKNNWTVTAYPNGDIYLNNKYYYGLYWEEEGSSLVDFKEGFYVSKENAIDFLDEMTEKIGFTRREANEFIMYWLPILEKNQHSLVYFELTDSRNRYNELKITPKPDSILRVAIHVKKVDGETYIKEQNIPKFNRKGFTAVEWGGVIH